MTQFFKKLRNKALQVTQNLPHSHQLIVHTKKRKIINKILFKKKFFQGFDLQNSP